MIRRKTVTVFAMVAAAVVSVGAWPSSAIAAVSQPVSGGGYYVAGQMNSGSVWLIVPTTTCAAGENSSMFIGLQSAGVDDLSSTFASGVWSVCVSGLGSTVAYQFKDGLGFQVLGVEPGDKVVSTFNHTRGDVHLKDVTSGAEGTLAIADASNQAGVFFGAHPTGDAVPMIEGGKVTLSVTVNGETLASASPVKQTKRIAGISLTPSDISAKTGKAFTVTEVDHNVA